MTNVDKLLTQKIQNTKKYSTKQPSLVKYDKNTKKCLLDFIVTHKKLYDCLRTLIPIHLT